MKKYIWLFSVVLLTNMLIFPALASDTFEQDTKVIYIDQLKQKWAQLMKMGKRSWSFRC